MVVIAKKRDIKRRLASKKWVLFMTSLGLTFIIIPFIFVFINPILMVANYRLRLDNGTLLHELLLQEIEGAKLYVYLFNITNADQFLSGEDDIVKVEEIGPFVYQEYRTNDDLEINIEPGIMRYTPNHRIELILEESIGRPEDIYLVLPNIALLSAVQMLSKYPYFIGQIFKMLISGMNLKALPRTSAQSYMWDNTDPLISMVNSVVPGLIYFKCTGFMTRFYDVGVKYRLTLSTTEAEKFQVKTVKKLQINGKESILENTKSYTNTYEGAAFPPKLAPETPIQIYRYSICKTLHMKFTGTKQMDYGSEAYVYNFDNTTFSGNELCNSKGWCPSGIMDLSSCYYGFPFAISKGHFLDTEPKMFEKIEGLKPNRSIHDTTFLIDPKIGVTVGAHMSAQLSLALGDMSLLRETKRLTDMYLPVTHTIIKHPRMREETRSSLRLLYHYGPYILLSAQALCLMLGVGLLVYSAKMMYWHRATRRSEKSVLSNKCSKISQAPLLN